MSISRRGFFRVLAGAASACAGEWRHLAALVGPQRTPNPTPRHADRLARGARSLEFYAVADTAPTLVVEAVYDNGQPVRFEDLGNGFVRVGK